MADFPLPNNTQHILLVGQNGSGKTRAAMWHFSKKDVANEVWVVINHKREEMINSIPGAVFLPMNKRPDLKKPGVYIYQPRPEFDDDAVTLLLWWIYEHGRIGVYIDEGYMIHARDPALCALYTQGRSKRIPVITLSQRPTAISRFAVSEASYIQLFFIVDKRDRKTIQEFIPSDICDIDEQMRSRPGKGGRPLAKYHSIYYPTSGDAAFIMKPVPSDDEILAVFREKLVPEPKGIVGLKFL